ncbi:hypothetical protein D1007_57429 [Hordeum vulgare]|nr:hypothetical protein D1007_57429 [Hordeum vulgare]
MLSSRPFWDIDLTAPNRMVIATRTSTFSRPSTGESIQQPGAGGSAQAGFHQEQTQGDIPPPPPPPVNLTVAQFLQALREERQANNATIQHIAQPLVSNPPQGGNCNGCSTLSEFMMTIPPIFTETTEPVDADDWIRTIEDLLALVKCTNDREKVITWAVFKDGFRVARIPPGMMTIKKWEFRALKQGSGIVKEYMQKFNLLSRYTPHDVSTEATKVERFMEGLQQLLQYQLVVCDLRTICDPVNKALMLEDKRRAMEDTRKCKLMVNGGSSNQKARLWHIYLWVVLCTVVPAETFGRSHASRPIHQIESNLSVRFVHAAKIVD